MLLSLIMTINKEAVVARMSSRGIESQSQLAEAAGLNRYHVNKLLQGRPFTSRSLAALCDALDCEPGTILTR